jgi:hypothetical protein
MIDMSGATLHNWFPKSTKWFLYGVTLVIILAVLWFAYTPRYEVVVIDGCEYVATIYGQNRTLVHKANCLNHGVKP